MDGEPRAELGEQHEREVAGKLASWQLQGEDASQGLTPKTAGTSLAVIAREVAGALQSLDMQ